MNYNESWLLDPNGKVVWKGSHADRREGFKQVEKDAGPAAAALAKLAGMENRPDGTEWVSPTITTQTLEKLGFISRDGCAPGFFVLLPPATHIDRVVNTFNQHYLKKLNAQEIEFPLVFDNRSKEMKDLTASYEDQGMMFRLDQRDEGLRLSYAADAGIFPWLQGKKLRADALPCAITSPTMAMRRHMSGQLGSYGKARQYKLQDLHILTTDKQADEQLQELVQLNSNSIRFWVEGRFAQFADTTRDFVDAHPDLPSKMALSANSYTFINFFTEKPRYYTMRSGLMADSGMGVVMMYNIQWDEENGKRFRIKCDDGTTPVVIHGNALAGSGLLNTVVGSALADATPKVIPAELAIAPVTLIQISEQFNQAALEHQQRLAEHGIASQVKTAQKSLGKTVWKVRDAWVSAHAVIGEKEPSSKPLVFSQGRNGDQINEADFVNRYSERAKVTRPGFTSSDAGLSFLL